VIHDGLKKLRRAAYGAPFRVHRPEPDWEGVSIGNSEGLRATSCGGSRNAANTTKGDQADDYPGRRIGTTFAPGMIEAGKQFRRVNGHLHLPTLRAALERQSAESVGPVVHDDQVNAA
jgi:hypothetical protein